MMAREPYASGMAARRHESRDLAPAQVASALRKRNGAGATTP